MRSGCSRMIGTQASASRAFSIVVGPRKLISNSMASHSSSQADTGRISARGCRVSAGLAAMAFLARRDTPTNTGRLSRPSNTALVWIPPKERSNSSMNSSSARRSSASAPKLNFCGRSAWASALNSPTVSRCHSFWSMPAICARTALMALPVRASVAAVSRLSVSCWASG